MSRWQNAGVPPGERIYAIGDIHGRLDLLDGLLDIIAAHNDAWPVRASTLVFLGDYVDRGPSSKGVVDRFLSGLPAQFKTRFLKGNHEALMLDFLADPETVGHWLPNGGDTTMLSYGVDEDIVEFARSGKSRRLRDASHAFAEKLPAEHLAFYESLDTSFSYGGYFFVHGGVRPKVRLEDQKPTDMLWIRDKFLNYRGDFGAVVVHGHTPAAHPEDMENRIGIDTGAWRSGRLTAVCLEGNARSFLSTASDR